MKPEETQENNLANTVPHTLIEKQKDSGNIWMTGHFNVIRNFSLADYISLGNTACGMAAIFTCINYNPDRNAAFIYRAVGFTLLGLLLDMIDGPIARYRRTTSEFGRELDSFGDAISFAVAPALIAYVIGFNSGLDCLILILFTMCGISRLSRFNVTSEAFSFGGNKVKLILGLPVAGSLLPTGLIVILLWSNNLWLIFEVGRISLGTWILHPFVLLYLFVGLLMISNTFRFNRPWTK